MVSQIEDQKDDYNDENVGPLDHVPQAPCMNKITVGAANLPAHKEESQSSLTDSVVTAREDNHGSPEESIDKIETASEADDHPSKDRVLHFTDTIKDVTHSAKKKLYIHHRHQRRFSQQITPGTRSQQLKEAHPNLARQKIHHDPEGQVGDIGDDNPSPSFVKNLRVMFTTFPYWNMAFWSGWCYSIGSALFIIDGAWAWVPQQWPETEFEGQSKYGVPLLFFFGACLYQVGGVMAYLEAINDGSFAGAAMKRLLSGHEELEKDLLDAKLHTFFGHIVPHRHHDDEHNHHHHDTPSEDPEAGWKALTETRSPEELYTETKKIVKKESVGRRSGVDEGAPKEGVVREYISWRWWPTWHALRTYHIFELGYVSCAIQLFGVTLYGVTSVVILPGILDSLAPWQVLASYWIPQVVASCCFLWASIMFTVMAQERWYKPKWRAVSWWIGIWAQAGSVGFL